MKQRRVVIGSGDNFAGREYAAALARELAKRDCDVAIVVASPESRDDSSSEELVGLDVVALPHAPYDDWSDKWIAFIRCLEERAPCVYLSVQDWVAACVTPRLSSRVRAVGVLVDDSTDEQEHCFRMAPSWDAVVAVSGRMRQRVMVEHQDLAARLASIHAGNPVGASTVATNEWGSIGNQYLDLFNTLDANAKSGRFRRERGRMAVPPASVFHACGRVETGRAIKMVNAVPMWPDPVAEIPRTASVVPSDNRDRVSKLHDHRIVFAVPTGRISGVDIFAVNLASELLSRGYNAEILQTDPPDRIVDGLPIPDGVPVHHLRLREFATWPERWRAMRAHLEERAPCLYIPNYDTRHSASIPTFSSGIKSVGIAHSDDPHHYEHIVRLAPWWDAVAGVSNRITETVSALAPELEQRTTTIPYGVKVPPELPQRNRKPDEFLRAVYAGRVTRYQKRTLDLVSVAEILDSRHAGVEITIIGNGPDAPALVAASSHLVLKRRMRWIGSLPNARVLDVFADSDVFVLPSSFEGLPVSLLEAMAHGCVPVVYGIRSGIPDVITDGVNGFVVPIGDVEAMAERLTALENDEALLRRMGMAAYETIRDGCLESSAMTDSYIALFERAISNPRLKPEGGVARPPELTRLDVHMPRLPLPLRKTVWGLKRSLGIGGSQ